MRIEGVMSAVLGVLACLFALAGLASLYSGYDLGGTERGIAYTVSGTVALAAGALLFGLMCLSLRLSQLARLLALPAERRGNPLPAQATLPPHLEVAVPAAVGAAVAAAAADLAQGERPLVPLVEPEKPAGETPDSSQLPLDLRLSDPPETAPPSIEADFGPFDRLLAEEREQAAAGGAQAPLPDALEKAGLADAGDEPRKRPAWMDSVFPEAVPPTPAEVPKREETLPAEDGESLLPELRGLPDTDAAPKLDADDDADSLPSSLGDDVLPGAEAEPEVEERPAPEPPARPVEEPGPEPALATGPGMRDAPGGAAQGLSPEEPPLPAGAVEAPSDATAAPGRKVIGSYAVGRSSYTMYDDGSVEALTEAGLFSFSSLDELRAFIEQGPAARS